MATPRQSAYQTSSSGGVYAGLAPSEWASGIDTGTFIDGVWNPARGASGRVTAASWAIVPNNANAWVEIAGTRMDALDAVVKALPGYSGWTNRGNEGWNGVLKDWGGMASDLRGGTERCFIVCVGGHDGGSNDGIYPLSLRKMAWEIELAPSLPAYWDAAYTVGIPGGFTFYPWAKAYAEANPNNAEGVWWDEFFDPTRPTDANWSSRRPAARHTYASVVFVPTLGASGKLLMGARRYWEYDLATKKWALPVFPLGGTPGTYGTAYGYTEDGMTAWWNAGESRYYVGPTKGAGDAQFYSIQPGGINGRAEGAFPNGGYAAYRNATEDDDTYVWVLSYWDVPLDQAFGRPIRMIRKAKAGGAQTSYAITVGASLSGHTFTAGTGWDGMGATYVPPVGKWLCLLSPDSGGQIFAWLDPATWTLEAGPNVGVPGGDYRLQNKVRWFPSIGAVFMPFAADQNVRFLKP